MFWGATLIIVGAIILLNRLEIIDMRLGEYLLPVVLIAWGAKIISGSKQRSNEHHSD